MENGYFLLDFLPLPNVAVGGFATTERVFNPELAGGDQRLEITGASFRNEGDHSEEPEKARQMRLVQAWGLTVGNRLVLGWYGAPEIFNTDQLPNLHRRRFSMSCSRQQPEPRWTVEVPGWLTSSSRGYDDHSNTNVSIGMLSKRGGTQARRENRQWVARSLQHQCPSNANHGGTAPMIGQWTRKSWRGARSTSPLNGNVKLP